jgi:hypothetical protein
MSKADTLLKKATFFERLAVYSDRKSFLQALAQGGGTDDWMSVMNSPHTDADVKARLDQIIGALQNWREQYGTRMVDAAGSPRLFPNSIAGAAVDIMNAAKYTHFDKELLGQIYQALRTVAAINKNEDIEGDAREAFIESVFKTVTPAMDMVYKTMQAGGTRPEAPKEDDSGPAYPGMGLKQMDGHAVPEKEAPGKPAAPAYPPINKQDQAAVFKFVTDENLGVPVGTPDGSLGPVTRKALDAVKDYFVRTYPQSYPSRASMSDAQAITAAKTPKR